jgi:hypothetical protein
MHDRHADGVSLIGSTHASEAFPTIPRQPVETMAGLSGMNSR